IKKAALDCQPYIPQKIERIARFPGVAPAREGGSTFAETPSKVGSQGLRALFWVSKPRARRSDHRVASMRPHPWRTGVQPTMPPEPFRLQCGHASKPVDNFRAGLLPPSLIRRPQPIRIADVRTGELRKLSPLLVRR